MNILLVVQNFFLWYRKNETSSTNYETYKACNTCGYDLVRIFQELPVLSVVAVRSQCDSDSNNGFDRLSPFGRGCRKAEKINNWKIVR